MTPPHLRTTTRRTIHRRTTNRRTPHHRTSHYRTTTPTDHEPPAEPEVRR